METVDLSVKTHSFFFSDFLKCTILPKNVLFLQKCTLKVIFFYHFMQTLCFAGKDGYIILSFLQKYIQKNA